MICDVRTCSSCQYHEDERDDGANLAEFLVNCQQAKCKVVRLVRQQISKLQNTQYERFLKTNDAHKNNEPHQEAYDETSDKEVQEALHGEVYEVHDEVRELYDGLYETQGKAQRAHDEAQEEAGTVVARRIVETKYNAVTPWQRTASLGNAVDRKWMLRVLSHVRHRARLILAAAAVGVIVWSALVYGVFLGATACGSGGRSCYASSLKYTHAKRSLF